MRLGAVFGEGRTALSLAAVTAALIAAAAIGYVALREDTPAPPAGQAEDTAPSTGGMQPVSGEEASGDGGTESAQDGMAEAQPPTPTPEPPSPTPDPPGFDQIRVAPDGSTVVAGRAPAGSGVSLRVDGQEVADTRAAADGGFAAIFGLEPSDTPRIMSLLATTPEGEEIAGVETVIIAPFGPRGTQIAASEPRAEGASETTATAGERGEAGGSEMSVPAEAGSAEPEEDGQPAEMAAGAPDRTSPDASASGERLASDGPDDDIAEPGSSTREIAAATSSEPASPAEPVIPAETAADRPTADEAADGGVPDDGESADGGDTAGATNLADGTDAADAGVAAEGSDTTVSGELAENTAASDRVADSSAPPAATSRPDVVAELDAPATPGAPPSEPAAGPQVGRAPSVVIAGPEGLRVAQGTGTAPAGGTPAEAPSAQTEVQLDAIAYDREGDVILSGRGPADAQLRILLDDRPVELGEVGPGGTWSLDLPDVDPGTYTLTVTQLSPEGEVESRVDTPFLREDPARIAANPMLVGPGVSVITVQPGFTLWGIAEANFGQGLAYVQIFERNRDRIRDPHWIYPGQIFRLPDLPRTADRP